MAGSNLKFAERSCAQWRSMRLPQLPRTSRLASSLLAGLLATGVWHPCQPPAPASALVRDGGGSTLRLAVALTPEAAQVKTLF